MTWFGWTMVGYFGISAFSTISGMGKRREPSTPLVAAIVATIFVAVAVGVLAIGTGHL